MTMKNLDNLCVFVIDRVVPPSTVTIETPSIGSLIVKFYSRQLLLKAQENELLLHKISKKNQFLIDLK